MALPAQIQAQVDNANALREQMGAEQAPADPSQAAAQEAPTEVVEPAVEAAETQEVVRPHETPATQAEDENSQTYAQRWRSLQGTYNSTKHQLSAAEQRIANLEQLVTSFQAPPRQQAQSAQRLVTDKDSEAFGEDMVDFARRVTREEMSQYNQTLAQLQQQLANLQGLAPVVQQVANKQHVSSQQAFVEHLSRAVPDWASVNDNPGFHEWLLSPDSMTGITRQTYLADAESALDLQRVVSIFQAWKRENAVHVAPQAPQPQARSANVTKLELQVAPGRASAASTAPTSTQGKTYSRADISKFYADKLKGAYKGREAEASAMERDIFMAQREGRVVLSAA